MEKLKSVPSRIWRRVQPPPATDNSTPGEGSDVTTAPPVDPLQMATEENARLQNTVRDLSIQLQALEGSHASLQSRTDDLNHKLQLEQRRIDWQRRFYEKKIVEVAMGVVVNNGGSGIDSNALLASISQDFYQQTISELVAEAESKEGEISQLKNSFQNEIQALKLRQEAELAEFCEQNCAQVAELTLGQEELIRDLLSGCETGLFKEMKEEYLVDAENNVELQTTNGNKIWVQFEKFSSQKKGICIVVICIVTVATAGWAGWGFITWVWPRLLLFADSVLANPQTLSTWMTYLIEFLNSPQFQTFVLGWEQGQPLASCLKPFLNTALLASALNLAPNLFAQLKNRKGRSC